MKAKILYFVLLSIASEATYASQEAIAKTLSPSKKINSIQSITQAPRYSPWSWQHIKNLATLAILPAPTTRALAQKHRAEFRKKLLQDEEDALKDLVDTNSPLWKNLEKYDKNYEQSIKTENPDRQYDRSLPKEWIQHANPALEERGINPRGVNFLTSNEPNAPASSSITFSEKNYSLLNYPLYGYKANANLSFNQSYYNEHIAHLPHTTQQAILSGLAKHESTHLQFKHPLTLSKIHIYHERQQTTPDTSAFIAAAEKTADTLPTLKSREDARNALIYFKHEVGYAAHKPDIKIEKSYHDVEHLHKQKQQIQNKVQQLQKTVHEHPLRRSLTQSSQGLYNKAMNTLTTPYRWYKKNSAQ